MHDYIPTAIGLPAAALACLWLWWLERRDARTITDENRRSTK